VGQNVTQATNDKQQLVPAVEAIKEQAGQKPQEVLTDSGYCSEANLKYLEKKKIEGFVATDRESYRDREEPGPRGPLPQGATRVDHMRRKLQTKMGAAIYSRRKTIVEPVFGQIKQARGFRQFLLRGLEKVQGEWAMICLTHNILNYIGFVMDRDRREQERPFIKVRAISGRLSTSIAPSLVGRALTGCFYNSVLGC